MNFCIETKLLIMNVASCSLFQKVVVGLVEIRAGFGRTVTIGMGVVWA